jgi:hypothetical protein
MQDGATVLDGAFSQASLAGLRAAPSAAVGIKDEMTLGHYCSGGLDDCWGLALT